MFSMLVIGLIGGDVECREMLRLKSGVELRLNNDNEAPRDKNSAAKTAQQLDVAR